MKIKDLKPNEKNPRTVTDAKIKMLAKSLEEFGDLSGFVFNRKSGQLVGGHQRTKVLPKDSEILITKKYEKPTRTGTLAVGHVLFKGERFSYREVSFSKEKELAANLAANKGAGEWDMTQVSEMMNTLKGLDFDLNLTLFDETERSDFFTDDKKGLTDDDAVPEVPKVAKSKRGEIYQLGEHRIMCGDSTSKEDVEKLMNREKADMVFTDPPYGMRLDTNFHQGDLVVGNSYRAVEGDDKDYDPRPLLSHFESVEEVFIWGADYFHSLLPNNGSFLVWDKRNDELETAVGNDFELCWSKKHHKRLVCRMLWSGFTARERSEARIHPTQKPIKLAEWFFERWGKEANLIVDLYLGSGSTLIACEKTNRKCYGMEIDPHYCDVIIERWEKFTGKKAMLLLDDSEGAERNGKRTKFKTIPKGAKWKS